MEPNAQAAICGQYREKLTFSILFHKSSSTVAAKILPVYLLTSSLLKSNSQKMFPFFLVLAFGFLASSFGASLPDNQVTF